MEPLSESGNQKLATSNLNLRAPKFGQTELLTEITVTTGATDGAGDPKSAVFRLLWPLPGLNLTCKGCLRVEKLRPDGSMEPI